MSKLPDACSCQDPGAADREWTRPGGTSNHQCGQSPGRIGAAPRDLILSPLLLLPSSPPPLSLPHPRRSRCLLLGISLLLVRPCGSPAWLPALLLPSRRYQPPLRLQSQIFNWLTFLVLIRCDSTPALPRRPSPSSRARRALMYVFVPPNPFFFHACRRQPRCAHPTQFDANDHDRA